MTLRRSLTFLAATLVSSNAPAPAVPVTPTPAPARTTARPTSARLESRVVPVWVQLVQSELIWRRPDLDHFCDASRRGYFIVSSPPDVSDQATLAAELDCQTPTLPTASRGPA